jgi:hypothetical protein
MRRIHYGSRYDTDSIFKYSSPVRTLSGLVCSHMGIYALSNEHTSEHTSAPHSMDVLGYALICASKGCYAQLCFCYLSLIYVNKFIFSLRNYSALIKIQVLEY